MSNSLLFIGGLGGTEVLLILYSLFITYIIVEIVFRAIKLRRLKLLLWWPVVSFIPIIGVTAYLIYGRRLVKSSI